jgi:glucose-6-phosphate 1-epimerase
MPAAAGTRNAGNNDRTIPDLGAGNHKGYLCVERADAAGRAVDTALGETYRTTMRLGVGEHGEFSALSP